MVPLFCYLVVNSMSKGKVKMPHYYGIERIDSQAKGGQMHRDTIYHQIKDLVLTNQLGQKVSLNKDLDGKILVVDLFFTTCPSTCPQLTTNMRLLQNSFKKDTKKEASLDTVVQFISITVDPLRDTFPALRAYADKYGANHDHWWFLTGDKKTIYDFARNELGVATGPGDGGADDFIHTSQFVLIDKDRVIRGYYNGLSDTEARKCADDIVLLTLEKKHKK
jgi:protein SCO1/2